MKEEKNRTAAIVRVSMRGIGVNLMLVAFKVFVGLAANSIAVLLDAVNNLSDALSSIITIVGTKLAGKAADSEHPYGHGRIEYITATVIGAFVLTAGGMSMKESVEKLMHPEEPHYTVISLVLISVGFFAKILLGTYYRKQGKHLNSASLIASGTDALFDSVISLATLFGAAVNLLFRVNPDGVLGAVISLFIIKAGIGILRDTVNSIIGVRADSELTDKIKERINAHPEVYGTYDLILHNYGPDVYFASAHIEADDSMSVWEFDRLTRRITAEIYREFGIILTLGVYAANNSDSQAKAIKEAVFAEVEKHPSMKQVHGFYLDEAAKTVSFDVIFDFQEKSPEKTVEAIRTELTGLFPDYSFHVQLDRDFSD